PLSEPSQWELPPMLRALCLAMTVPVLLLTSADARCGPGANAALQYWQAFATLPRFTGLEHKKLEDSLTTPLDEQARDMVTRAAYSLRMMYRGASLSGCEWGIGCEEGLEHRLP